MVQAVLMDSDILPNAQTHGVATHPENNFGTACIPGTYLHLAHFANGGCPLPAGHSPRHGLQAHHRRKLVLVPNERTERENEQTSKHTRISKQRDLSVK